jgi:hypothetical protein
MTTSVSPRPASVHPTRQQLDELDALLQRMLDLPVNQVDESAAAAEAEAQVPEFRAPVSYKVPIAEAPPLLEPRVVPAEEPPKPSFAPPPIIQAPRHVPPTPLAPVMREPGPDDWVRLASTWQPSAQTWQPLAQSWQQAARPGERVPAAPPAPTPEPLALPVAVSEPAPVVFAVPPFAPPVQPDGPPAEAALHDLVFPPVAPVDQPAPSLPETPAEVALEYGWWQWPFVAVNVVFEFATLPLGPLGAGLRTRAGRNLLAAMGLGCIAAAGALIAADGIGWIW